MKRIINFLLFLLLVQVVYGQQAKYVFYFIGDGMGVNQVNGTEMYQGELAGRIGVEPLLFSRFPVASMASTFSATNSVTDSSAAGTALATSVSVDHATPAAFYAHQPNRNMYYEIGLNLIDAGFDFYAGGGFLKPETRADGSAAPHLFPIFEEAGYTIARGYEDYKANYRAADRMILIQKEGAPAHSIPYAIDREEDDLTLAQITESAISFLTKNNKKGFFLMVEGGKIDWSCHSNDAATTLKEVVDMDDAVKVAYEFYKKYPKETLIVVTADHETGGMSLGTGRYEMNLKSLEYQTGSLEVLSAAITDLRKEHNNRVSWEQIKELLGEKMGFWKELPITWEQEKKLRDEYENSFVKNKQDFVESLYSRTEPLASRAKEVMSEIARVGWTSGGHSAGYVPVYAIGAGSNLFMGTMDNTDIPKRIAKAAGY